MNGAIQIHEIAADAFTCGQISASVTPAVLPDGAVSIDQIAAGAITLPEVRE